MIDKSQRELWYSLMPERGIAEFEGVTMVTKQQISQRLNVPREQVEMMLTALGYQSMVYLNGCFHYYPGPSCANIRYELRHTWHFPGDGRERIPTETVIFEEWIMYHLANVFTEATGKEVKVLSRQEWLDLHRPTRWQRFVSLFRLD